jgi:hypothetical protein
MRRAWLETFFSRRDRAVANDRPRQIELKRPTVAEPARTVAVSTAF